jgi:hypothetical protein
MKKCILSTHAPSILSWHAWWVVAYNKLVNEDKKFVLGKTLFEKPYKYLVVLGYLHLFGNELCI